MVAGFVEGVQTGSVSTSMVLEYVLGVGLAEDGGGADW